MSRQRTTKVDTVERHKKAFHDLISNPGRYSQSEWTLRHHIGNRSGTSALRMGLIERRDGMLYSKVDAVNTGTIRKVLNFNKEQRELEKHTNERTNAFYSKLPDEFTTAQALNVAASVGIPKVTMQRIFNKDKRFVKIRHGAYRKRSAYAETAPAEVKTTSDKGTANVTVNIAPRRISILWGLFRFTF